MGKVSCVALAVMALTATAKAEPAKLLIDTASNISLADWKMAGAGWNVHLRTLHGGRQEGVQVIDVVNGGLRFTIVPTRGFEIWKAQADGVRFGWDSPVTEIVHPALVDLTAHGGMGWLNGFGGWMVRGGLASFGSPGMDGADQLTLHGHVDYIPASQVSVRYEAKPLPRLVFRGVVKDAEMFGPQLVLTSEISTPIGKKEIALDDVITNPSDAPQEMQSLYHINFGPPLLGAGAEFVAPVRHVAPMDNASAAGGLEGWTRYSGPHAPGYAAQVFLTELQADVNGQTQAMLKSPDGSKAALLSFNVRELPHMSVWKNEGPAKSGYVTGLEPGTGFPYLRSVERKGGRVPVIKGGGSYRMRLRFTALTTKADVSAAVSAIAKLQAVAPVVQKTVLARP